jgi:hypothetical protein
VPDLERERRLALNETRFREINDTLEQAIGGMRHVPEEIEFVCECANLDCRKQITLTRAEYEQVRADPMLFAVADGHEIPDVEDVVRRTDRFLIIRKHSGVERIVESTDPRSP